MQRVRTSAPIEVAFHAKLEIVDLRLSHLVCLILHFIHGQLGENPACQQQDSKAGWDDDQPAELLSE